MRECKDCKSYTECHKAGKPCLMYEEKVMIKDKECLSCENMIDCKGKPRVANCINYKERKK